MDTDNISYRRSDRSDNGKIIGISGRDYRKAAERCLYEDDDPLRALGLLHSAKAAGGEELLIDYADAYFRMELYEISNRYWFRFLDRVKGDDAEIAYENLGVNCFYMDDYTSCAYYFKKKVAINPEFMRRFEFDEELLEYLAGENEKRIRIVYPYEKTDNAYDFKIAGRAVAGGMYDEAKAILGVLPKECLDEEACGDLATALYMTDDLDGAEKICRYSLEKFGESVTAYCNLATVYEIRKQYKKSDYYYDKALDCRSGDFTETYRILTCAMDRDDDETVWECLKDIVEDRPYDPVMRFYYGISALNLGEYALAEECFEKVMFIDPEDDVAAFYLNFSRRMKEGGKDKEKYLPLPYEKDLPEAETKKRRAYLNSLMTDPKKISLAVKRPENRKMLKWGLKCNDEIASTCAAFVLTYCDGRAADEVVRNALIDAEISIDVKRVLIFGLLFNGKKKKFGLVTRNRFHKIAPEKLSFEGENNGAPFAIAYAHAVSRMSVLEYENTHMLALCAEELYKQFDGREIDDDMLTALGALMCSRCTDCPYDEDKLCKIFGTDKKKFARLKKEAEDGK